MHYVDLGTLPKKKKNKKRHWPKILLVSFLVLSLSYVGLLLFWPATTVISKVLKAPMSALSIVRNPEGELKSTNGRTNILLLGLDKRAVIPYSYEGRDGKTYHNGFLSDTIIIVSLNLQSKDVAMVSVPRDFWVKIPGWGGLRGQYGKINSAYSIGDMYNYPGGGMDLARETISQNFDLPIHYVARIDFEGFKKMIDAVGGVEVNVERSFDDWNYPIDGKEEASCGGDNYNCRFEHLRFEKGWQHMNGETALKYARSRKGTNGEGSDFARAQRQQKILFALREKALSMETLRDPVKVAQVLSSFGETLETDLDLVNYPPLQKFSQEMDISLARTLVLSSEIKNGTLIYHPPPENYGGAWVLAPIGGDYQKVSAYIHDFLLGLVSEEKASTGSASQGFEN